MSLLYVGNIEIGNANYLGDINIPSGNIIQYQTGWTRVVMNDCTTIITGVTAWISDADWTKYSLGLNSVIYLPTYAVGYPCWKITSIDSTGTTPQTLSPVGGAYGTSCAACQAANP